MLVQTFILMAASAFIATYVSIAALLGGGLIVAVGVGCLLLFLAMTRIGEVPVPARRRGRTDAPESR